MPLSKIFPNNPLAKYLTIYAGIGGVMTFLAIISMQIHPYWGYALFQENGPVEYVTALFYLLCIMVLFHFGRLKSLTTHWYLYILIIALGLRELDFDKKFTTMGILKSRFLFSDEVFVQEKIIGLIIIIALLVAIIFWAKSHLNTFYRGVIQLKAPEWTLGFGFGLMILSKTIDGIGRKLEVFLVQITSQSEQLLERCEEIYELGIPVAFILAITMYWRTSKS